MRIYLNICTILLCLLSGSLVAQAATSRSITINPGYTTIRVGGTVQYTATVTGLTNTVVTWEVNGVPAGNSTNGTISTSGLYKAPATVPAGNSGTTVIALGSDGKTMDCNCCNSATVS
jgi:hypothetical protein